MTENDEVDVTALGKLVDWHLENGTNAIVVCGTTGEASTLRLKEKQTVIGAVVKAINGRIPVIAGTSANATWETIELSKMALELGVDGLLLMTPAYIKPTQEGLYQHYSAIATAVPCPIILYNNPGRTVCDMSAQTVARLADVTNIVGIKEASGSVERSREILTLCGNKIDVYSGEDTLVKDIIAIGGKGVVSTSANVAPKLISELCKAASAGDQQKATEINEKLKPLYKALFIESNPIPSKWALSEMGLISSAIRSPLTQLSSDSQVIVRAALEQLKILK